MHFYLNYNRQQNFMDVNECIFDSNLTCFG